MQPREPRPGRTPLQMHCDFFDFDADDVIMPWDTYNGTPLDDWVGLRLLGFNVVMALYGTSVAHLFLSYSTQDGWMPDPFFSIILRNIHRAKHGSDSRVFDHDGNMRGERFHYLRTLAYEHDKSTRGEEDSPDTEDSVDFWQGLHLTNRNRDVLDWIGWWANKIEWFFMYALCAQNGRVQWRDIRGVFNGTLFYDVYNRRYLGITSDFARQ